MLRFENLTPDVSLDWMGRAASEIIAHEISNGQAVLSSNSLHNNPLAQFHPVSAPGESAEAAAALAEGATRLVMGQISLSRGHLILDLVERDTASGKNVQAFSFSAPNAADLYSLADSAARRLSSQITPFDSKNNQAIGAWARALEETDYARLSGEYSRAVQADPGFAAAWLAWAANATAHGDRPAAEKILTDAQQHAGGFNEVNRARLKLAGVQLTGDRAAAMAAMNDLARLLPGDVDTVGRIADQNFNARQFQNAVSGYRRVTQLAPNNIQAWNQLGYALMYSGDYAGAMSALQTYQKLAPASANPLDSQGDVAFAFSRFGEAEKLYEQAAAKDPSFEDSADLYKAAQARLMTGDVPGADQKFETYAAARRAAKDSVLLFRTAQWRFLSGRHDEAWSLLGKLVSSSDPQFQVPQLRSLALTQMAMWDLQLGHRDRALQESGEALKTGAPTPNTLIARFASEDAHTPADWAARADKILANPQLARVKPIAIGYALYLSQQWQAAAPVWKGLLDQSGPEDSIMPVIYARILVELKRESEAEPLVRLFPMLHPSGSEELLSLAVPAIFETRARILQSQGKTAESEKSRKVFETLWGLGAQK